MKKFPFRFMIGGSNDTGIAKMYPVTVRIYDVNFNRVMTKFLDMNLIEGSTSGTAVTAINMLMLFSRNMKFLGIL